MMMPGLPPNESERLEALRALSVLDTPREERFDRLTRLAQTVFDLPIVLVSLIDADRQWFKSCQGLGAAETPRGISFCAHAILQPDVFVVENATADPRFADNPLVTGEPHIRFYAGAPLKLEGGLAAGTLCVIGREPRAFAARERAVLALLAECVVGELRNLHAVQANGLLKAVIEGTTDAVFVKDSELRYRMVNGTVEQIFGRPRGEIIGKTIGDIVSPAIAAPITKQEEAILADGGVRSVENVLEIDGQRREFLSTKGVWRDERSRGGGIFGIDRDVTPLKELERVRAGVAHHVNHELRTPLASMLLALDMMKDSKLPPDALSLLDVAIRAGAHLQRMTQDLVESTKSATGKLSIDAVPGDAAAELRALTEGLAPMAARRGLTLVLEAPASLAARFDPVRLRQIAGNLVDNALKFTPKGGRVEIRAAVEEGAVRVSVIDNGPGMKKQDLDRIFDRLFQTAHKVQHGETGLGLGLHICRELVELHGGKIWVESTLGVGTAFHFTLPTT